MPSRIAGGLLGLVLQLAPCVLGMPMALAASPRVSGEVTHDLPVRFEDCKGPPPAARTTTRAVRGDELPDFVITDVRAPSRVYGRDPFEVVVTVCNMGRRAGSADVEVFVSRDVCIAKEDALLGAVSSGWVGAGKCASRSIVANKEASQSGMWFIGALVDPHARVDEVSEENNAHAGDSVTFDALPDFTVESVAVPSVVRPEWPFYVAARVCNRGQGSEQATVYLYRSSDAHIDTDDVVMRDQSWLFLDAGRCERVVFVGVLGEPGTSYLAFMVDPLNERPEADETNNLSVVSPLEVGSIPDYVVAALRAPAMESINGSLPVRATVCNQGTAPASATQVQFQLRASEPSAEGVLRVSSRNIPALEANQCIEWEESLGSMANAARSWRLVATVNPVGAQTEAHSGNNDRSVNVLLGSSADLSVTRIEPLTHALVPGASFTTEVTVCNTGTLSASALAVHVALSDGPDPRAGIRVGTRAFGALGKGCAVLPVVGTVPTQGLPATVHVKASVELVAPVGGEAHLENNALTGPVVGLGTGPDLVVTRIVAQGRAAWPEGKLPVSVTVCNQGNVRTPRAAVQTLFVPEVLPEISAGIQGAKLSVESLAPGACITLDAEARVPYYTGAFRLAARADIDNAITELVESNNDALGDIIQVTQLSGLVVTDLQAPTAINTNATINATATVCNRSPVAQPGTAVGLALRTEDDFPVSALSEYVVVPALVPGACAQATLRGWSNVPQEGAYRLVAYLGDPWDVYAPEQWRALLFSVPIAVGGWSDFAVTAVSAPVVVQAGDAYSTEVSVCNRGFGQASASVRAYLSRDEHLDPAVDVRVGQMSVTLARGQCRTVSVSSRATVSSGDVWYVAADVSVGSLPDLVSANDGQVGARMVVTP
ncbi:hypothetical protein MXAN_4979 [Myxococcus xanthus DK 1622]|uniref:CARDB domain-containing protein n=1 Tax=Myxococcus xanthus (strain DK1622) TaxID=246197 RepID=Q1D2I8_MYXXD|nr:hypothetical protein MXAN_4979 [Myxococcus xanthus DK 1622]QZZ52643.1 hypothetical protein MyxoNM_25875 [Myxococcus xanthus]SDX52230.1 CARDB protein [Myxococcus xanthus]